MKNFLRWIGVIGDYVLLLASLFVVVYFRTDKANFSTIIIEHYRIFLWIFLTWIFMFYLFDLYNFDVPPRFTRFFFCLLLCILSSALFFYNFYSFTFIAPKTNLALIGVLFSLCFYFWRIILDKIFVYVFHGHDIMLAVSDQDSCDLVCLLYKHPRYKYHIRGVLVSQDWHATLHECIPEDLLYNDIKKFEESIKSRNISTIVSTSMWFTRLYGTMYDLLPRSVRIINMVNFHEHVLGYIPVHSVSQYWIMTNVDFVSSRVYMTFKRLLDIMFAIIILPLALIVMFIVAIAIKLFGKKGTTILFSQKRVGLFNKEFILYKFRTMIMDAEKNGAQWAVGNDPRVTRLGRLLRLTRLDELPQIFNVLKGEMSFIGPRPERMEFVRQLVKAIPHYQLRHMIKPGLSGWAQVKFRYGNSIEDSAVKLCYDLYYIKNINLILDTRIFVRTIHKVFSAGGQ